VKVEENKEETIKHLNDFIASSMRIRPDGSIKEHFEEVKEDTSEKVIKPEISNVSEPIYLIEEPVVPVKYVSPFQLASKKKSIII
jgi:hypothetical protein